MIRIKRNPTSLFKLADATGTRDKLEEKLEYLDNWGEDYAYYTNVDLYIVSIQLDKREADIALRFYKGEEKPELKPNPEPRMYGGLNLVNINGALTWSVNT